MDDLTFGLAMRRVRLRRNDRQADVALRAGVSQATYSELERGHLDTASIRMIRAVASALEIRVELIPRWRGGDLDRLVHGRHAAMGAVVADRLRAAGWDVAPEVSFNHYGERGIIDLVGWRSSEAALLIVELKTELVDVNELLGSMDRRLRLARRIAADRGWEPRTVNAWVVLAESRMNRRHASAARGLLRAAFPEDGRAVAGWVRRPVRRQLALWFLTDNAQGSLRRALAPRKRVAAMRSRSPAER